MITKFEDYTTNIEGEDYLDNSQKTPYAPGSYKDMQSIRLKEKDRLKSKKRKVNTLGGKSGHTGINTKDAKLWFRDDY